MHFVHKMFSSGYLHQKRPLAQAGVSLEAGEGLVRVTPDDLKANTNGNIPSKEKRVLYNVRRKQSTYMERVRSNDLPYSRWQRDALPLCYTRVEMAPLLGDNPSSSP